MSNTVFRQSSVDRMNSPEQLNEYIRVARPGVWLVLAAVVLLLLGVVVWGVFGTVKSVVGGAVIADGTSDPYCYIRVSDMEKIKPGMTMTIGEDDVEATIVSVSGDSHEATADETRILEIMDSDAGELYFTVEIDAEDLEPGIYRGEIVVEEIRPMTFVTQ